MTNKPKIAIVHDWLVVNGGAEKVLENIIEIFPDADIFSLVDYLEPLDRGWLNGKSVKTSFIQRLPFSKKHYRNYLPLFPIAIEQLDVTQYDIVISSSYSVAKGVITSPDQVHICYCHSPARYAWDLQFQYLKESQMDRGLKSMIARYFLHKFRIWDTRTANSVDQFVANSDFIRKRIYKCYRREAKVIFPPVDVVQFSVFNDKEDFYLTASRMVPYKRLDLVVEAFTKMPDKILRVIGDGPEMSKIKEIANGYDNIEIMGFQSDEVLVENMQKAKAFVFAAKEDFGIIPVEAQACGTPVIAYGQGGCLETVKHGVTGILFAEQTLDCLISAVSEFEKIEEMLEIDEIRKHAELFSREAFKQNFAALVLQTKVN